MTDLIIDFPSPSQARRRQLFVLLDLQPEHANRPGDGSKTIQNEINNCNLALRHARVIGAQVIFMRWRSAGFLFGSSATQPGWIDGFLPARGDIVLERDKPSCYSHSEFHAIVSTFSDQFVLAGFSGEAACIATIIDAFHQNHVVTYLNDSSMSHTLGLVSSDQVHRVVTSISDVFGNVTTTDRWVTNSCRRKEMGFSRA